MKILSIVMAVSALALFSVPSSAEPIVQKDMMKVKVDHSIDMQRPSDNRTNSLSEKRVYKKAVGVSRQIGPATEESKNDKIQQAAKNIVVQLKKEVDEKTPKEFIVLIKRMEADNDFAFNLTKAIGTQNKEEANSLLTKATGSRMNVDYTDTNSEIMSLKLCAYRNGVKHCFPSQRNSVKCVKF